MDSLQERTENPATIVEQREALARAVRSIASQFEVMMGRAEQVQADCDRLRQLLSDPPTASEMEVLQPLPPLLRKRSGAIAETLFALLEEIARGCATPWPPLAGMLAARNPQLIQRALKLTVELADSGSLEVDRPALRFLAERVEAENSSLIEPGNLDMIARVARHFSESPQGPATINNRQPATHNQQLSTGDFQPLTALYLHEAEGSIRRLAARLLDRGGETVPPDVARQLLGAEAQAFLAPYLAYTRANHLDLLYLAPLPGTPPPALPSLRRAEALCGETLLREALAELGWLRVNLGLRAQRYLGVSVSGSLPLMVSPAEAQLFEQCGETRRASEAFLFIAHGGLPGDAQEGAGDSDLVTRFRNYNLTHAAALADILDLAPLDREKVQRILSRMDRIVEDFSAIFAAHTDECAILPGLYRDLKEKILRELEKEPDHPQLSAELTRLVQMFEDPRSLGQVRTLHGLKRYLHQRGLRLGFRLVEASRAPNRTVDLALASPKKVLAIIKSIRYTDFENAAPAGGEGLTHIPYPVEVAVEGFSRQLFYGQESFPRLDVFCYGNEVHYYLSFRNHPAFLRIDYAPPLQGGMIDLEYFGVSNYELDTHPNRSLDFIRLFFQRLEFDIRVEGTRIHARYDKERALDLGNLCEKAEAIFRLAPYFMEIDWVIGSLKLEPEARRIVAENWAEAFSRWGVLPLRLLLTEDRQGIVETLQTGPLREQVIAWTGRGSYRDRFSIPPPGDFFAKIYAALDDLGLDILPAIEEESRHLLGQHRLERRLLSPLHEALGRGEIIECPEGFRRASPEVFQRDHEVERFAEILAAGDETLASAALLARLIAPLERTLKFHTTGSVEGLEVQAARLPLRGETIGLFVLRGPKGIIRLALFSRGEVLFRRREDPLTGRVDPSFPWRSNGSCDAVEMASLLRGNNYSVPAQRLSAADLLEEVQRIRDSLRGAKPLRRPAPLPGERILSGLRASPGQAVGRALFRTAGRIPDDFDGAVLVAASVRPEDNTFLYHAAAIVSTGGGILSHAGLIAAQFHKPALIISGEWQQESDGNPILRYHTLEYREEEREARGLRVWIREDLREREHVLREGDLVVVDAGEGTMQVLGQDRDALSLHEGFRQFAKANQLLSRASAGPEILSFRGRRLRARHQIEKILLRLADPVLTCHAVRELLAGERLAPREGNRDEIVHLLSLLLNNPRVGPAAREHLLRLTGELERRYGVRRKKALAQIPGSPDLWEILILRLDLLRLQRARQGAAASLAGCGIPAPSPGDEEIAEIDRMARQRLKEMRREIAARISNLPEREGENARRRHLLRQIGRIDELLDTPPEAREPFQEQHRRLAASDAEIRKTFAGRYLLTPGECGLELYPLIGWKAANLAELERLTGPGLVPPWFVVADHAFREVLDASIGQALPAGVEVPAGAATLREAIDAILARPELSNAQKSLRIRGLWERINLPAKLAEEVVAGYRRIGALSRAESPPGSEDDEEPFVAIRSSAREEDAEIAARAGEFETFLFIRGEDALLQHLKRTWSGLWTERAIHNRAVLGSRLEQAGGGVIVQRIVCSRVSGVLQTVNFAGGELREMVINAGLGMGEGIVSGAVEADQITVSKEGDLENGPLRFSYITREKREQVIFNRRAGLGTVRSETLYHQRLRPALEYVELCELVRAAAGLEAAYGYPLDIEFGIETSRLWILQVRPVAIFLSALQETRERFPLSNFKGVSHDQT